MPIVMKNALSNIIYDLRGLRCPLPVLKTEKKLKNLGQNIVLEVLSDDPLAPLDIEHLCKTYGYSFICNKSDSYVQILIKKN